MDCCDWLWFVESLDDFDRGVAVQPMPPRRPGLRTLLRRSLTRFRANRRVGCRLSSHDDPPQTKAA